MSGLFLTLDGAEGGGKTTQLARLHARLEAEGFATVRTREPGGDAVGEKVRELLLSTEMTSEAEFLLFAAARAQNVAQIIRPALHAGKIVLCDRFTDSSIAYQGVARGLPLETIRTVNAFATKGLIPDRTFWLDLPAELGLARRHALETNRLDHESLEFHKKVRNGFLDAARREPNRIVVIDASQSLDTVADELWAAVAPLLNR